MTQKTKAPEVTREEYLRGELELRRSALAELHKFREDALEKASVARQSIEDLLGDFSRPGAEGLAEDLAALREMVAGYDQVASDYDYRAKAFVEKFQVAELEAELDSLVADRELQEALAASPELRIQAELSVHKAVIDGISNLTAILDTEAIKIDARANALLADYRNGLTPRGAGDAPRRAGLQLRNEAAAVRQQATELRAEADTYVVEHRVAELRAELDRLHEASRSPRARPTVRQISAIDQRTGLPAPPMAGFNPALAWKPPVELKDRPVINFHAKGRVEAE